MVDISLCCTSLSSFKTWLLIGVCTNLARTGSFACCRALLTDGYASRKCSRSLTGGEELWSALFNHLFFLQREQSKAKTSLAGHTHVFRPSFAIRWPLVATGVDWWASKLQLWQYEDVPVPVLNKTALLHCGYHPACCIYKHYSTGNVEWAVLVPVWKLWLLVLHHPADEHLTCRATQGKDAGCQQLT